MEKSIARVAMLLCSNGGTFEIAGQVGVVHEVDRSVNRYGRTGLTIEEAFELTYYRGMFDSLRPEERETVARRLKQEADGQIIEIASATDVKRLLASGS